MLNELKRAILEWQNTKNCDSVCEKICVDLPKWLYEHIGQMDIIAAEYIADAKKH